jgi:serine/threonine-protein kinase
MLSESEKRAAHLAVSRYGADRARVQQILQAVQESRARGERADVLDLLLESALLAVEEIQEIRTGLEVTQIDPNRPQAEAPPAEPPPNGQVRPSLPSEGGGAADGELRQLGEFRILRRLGEGGMGAVYLGYQEAHDRQVALKVLPAHMAGNQALLDRFYREAKSGALLNHPNIVRNIAVGQDRATGQHYLVLEFVDGPSAQTLLEEHGKLSVGDAVHIVLDIARALEHVHSRNVVHRDIKPANILITQTGVAKLADLGLAKRTDEASHLTAARQGFGTPYYMPYEQAMNARQADARSDIYALGATLYHLLTGEVPFPGTSHLEIVDKKNLGFFEPASALNPAVPPALDQILAKMLAREPRDRYQTASELIVDLDRSELAAAVPSFVDAERALQDPVVRQRLATAAQPTCPDLSVASPPAREPGPAELWYLRYRDRHGQWCKAKATAEQIQKRLRAGKLQGEVEASRSPQGEFQPLTSFAEFVRLPPPEPRKPERGKKTKPSSRAPAALSGRLGDSAILAPPRNWVLLALAGSLAVLAAAFTLYILLRPA